MDLTPSLIINSTEEVFSCIMLQSITPGPPYYRAETPAEDGMTGVIYFSGGTTGYTAIHTPMETAEMVARDFLFGEDLDITEEVIEDTMREVVNILAGRVKAYIDPPGSNVSLSLPELRRGNDFSPAPLPDAMRITVPFYLDDGQFWVEVQLVQ